MDIIKTNLFQRIRLCIKVLKTKGYSKGYKIEELIQDEY